MKYFHDSEENEFYCPICGQRYESLEEAQKCSKKPSISHNYKIGDRLQFPWARNTVFAVVALKIAVLSHEPMYLLENADGEQQAADEDMLAKYQIR